MLLKFDEKYSFVPAIIFFFLFFWLGGISSSLAVVLSDSEQSVGHHFLLGILGYGFIISPIYTVIAALFYRIRLNKYALTSMLEGFVLGALVMIYYISLDMLNFKDVLIHSKISEYISTDILPVCLVCLFLTAQGLYIRQIRQRAKN